MLGPEGSATRPITDRAKQSLFDILAPRIDGSVVLDVFAGTGSMGLESLSRGARQAWFFEADRSALQRLKRNIDSLRLGDERAVIVAGDLFKRFAAWAAPGGQPPRADLVFLDPPYRLLRQQPDRLRCLAQGLLARHLRAGALVVFRHDAADALPLPGLSVADVRGYGGMTIEFLEPATTASDGE